MAGCGMAFFGGLEEAAGLASHLDKQFNLYMPGTLSQELCELSYLILMPTCEIETIISPH